AEATTFNGEKLLDGSFSEIAIHFGPGKEENIDYYELSIGDATASTLKLGSNADTEDHVKEIEEAKTALLNIDNAKKDVAKIRANIGSFQNRLQSTVANMQIQSENLQAAESRVSDVDVATEMTQFVRNQVLTQGAVAMLSQANSMPQMAMQLLA
ncbi:MAG: flagellin, partial [Desulfovibrionales bacterium]